MKKALIILMLIFGINSFGQTSVEFYNMGLSKSKSNDYVGAITDFTKAIALNPKYFEAFNSRGNAKNSMHDAKAAIQDLNKAIALNPEFGLAYYNRGVANFNLNQRKNACSDWKRARELGEMDANDFLSKYCK